MKNEEKILELLVETLQRIDRHHEEIERLDKKFDRHTELIQLMVNKLQEYDKRQDKYEEAFVALKGRTEDALVGLKEERRICTTPRLSNSRLTGP